MYYIEKLNYILNTKKANGWENTIFFNKNVLETVNILFNDETGSRNAVIESALKEFRENGVESDLDLYLDEDLYIELLEMETPSENDVKVLLEENWQYYYKVNEYMLGADVSDGDFDNVDEIIEFCEMINMIKKM